MSYYCSGFLFLPLDNPEASSIAAILQRSLEALGGIKQVRDVFVTSVLTRDMSPEQAYECLSLSPSGGGIALDIAGFNTTLWLSPSSINFDEGYHYLQLQVYFSEFAEIEGDPMRVELFATRWVSLCEALHAQAAYFGSTDNTGESDETALECIRELRRGAFWEFTQASYWRTYLDSAAAARWCEQDQQARSPWDQRSEVLPSGALVLSVGYKYNPAVDDDDSLSNARFLLGQVGQHPEVRGSEVLLEQLSQAEKELVLLEETYDYWQNEKLRVELDEIRATWAAAQEWSGLVGVEQSYVVPGSGQEVIVPVVAREGREWVLATLLYPFTLSEAGWQDEQSGLERRVQPLLAAAHEQNHSPQVVVLFWRGTTPEVREELERLGVRVEIGEHLPLLEEI